MKVACVQENVVFGDAMANAGVAIQHLDRLASHGGDLAIFPEAFLTGYCVDSTEQARDIAIPLDHPAIAAVAEAVDRLGMVAVVGFAEHVGDGRLANSAVLLEAFREPRVYRKVHLPELGLDKHVVPGDALPIFETRLGKLGILICFDLRPPEAVRTLALGGAELIALPTNWPVGAHVSADHISIARAAENRVFMATCNRAGSEHGFQFIGRSKIIDPTGKVLASAADRPVVIEAEVDLAHARVKRTVTIPGKYEIDVFGARRPELYGSLADGLGGRRDHDAAKLDD